MGGDFAQSKESLGNNFLLAEQSATLLPMNQVISQRGCEGRLGSPGRPGLPAPGPERKSSPGGAEPPLPAVGGAALAARNVGVCYSTEWETAKNMCSV